MTDKSPDAGKPKYPTHHWGAWAADPWGSDIVPDTPAWTAAMKRVWIRDGGTEADFDAIFGQSSQVHRSPSRLAPNRVR